MRVLELYAGIGGMHIAFKESTVRHEIVAAVEINDVATDVYKYNFPNTLTLNRVIESFSPDYVCSLNANIWSLCPPCQPFTRLGKRMCEADKRSSSFFHVLDLISILKPTGIILENVKGFEHSEPWRRLIEVLNSCDYEYRQFLLSPLQFGIPNCRLRFYLLARLRSSSWNSNFKMGQSESIDMRPPIDAPMLPGCQCTSCSGVISHIEHTDDNFTEYIQFCRPISEFVLVPSDSSKELYFLGEKCLQRYFRVLDIVRSCDKKTRCFTKGYSKRLEGTGSVFQTSMENETSEKIANYYEANKEDEQAVLQYAKLLKLRFFHSREVANMMCFPKSFDFPEHITEKQRLRLLGNSVNILVVSHLIYWVFGT
ncbi:unnamed protein product [Schistosoma margrebowiei]|uniref:tRNA (cytosine(38)-C(5))-methyltransferase n=2 Tax=Schistosoma margrebowiei TaxID=48269 RepID=A0AA85AC70_9TREM|nr:unnamed protein product [Schistosoma margrebowiei]